jgi:deoxycytidine triphosphate deaminase
MYEAVYRPNSYLVIDPYNEKLFLNSFYYFSLGALDESETVVALNAPLRIKPGQVEAVYSAERFEMSERVFAIIGNISTVLDRGLELLVSPSIDPGFTGNLQLKLRNHASQSVTISPGAQLGKAIFFDVSDSVLDTAEFIDSKLKEKELAIRERAAEVIMKTGGVVMRGEPFKDDDQ